VLVVALAVEQGRGEAELEVALQPPIGAISQTALSRLCQATGIEGTALLKMRITEQGRVEDVQVERSRAPRSGRICYGSGATLAV
jgi:outer membrane biosynthesis protein TonB